MLSLFIWSLVRLAANISQHKSWRLSSRNTPNIIQEYSALKENFKKYLRTSKTFGWVSTASRLEPLGAGSSLYTTKFPEIPGTNLLTSEGWKAESTLDPVVLNTGLTYWESSALTTRPLLSTDPFEFNKNGFLLMQFTINKLSLDSSF